MGMLVSGNLLPLMGVEPTLGRTFRPEEDRVAGRDAVVVLGRTMWEQEFGSDPSVLGRTVRINGVPFTVIGVAPSEFTGMNQYVRSDCFAPLTMSPRVISDQRTGSLEVRDARNLRLKGRLRSGVSQTEAQAELNTIAADLQRAYPDTNRNRGFTVRSELQSRISEDPPDAMLIAMLSTLAFAVLLVACSNVAGLLTSRAPVRAREIALRLAIGAGRARLVRQLVTESLLIAIAGGVVGLGVGYAGMLLFRQIEIPTDLPVTLAFRMDRSVALRPCRGGRERRRLRSRAGDSGDAHGSDGGDESERYRRARPSAPMGTCRARGRTGRRFRRPASRGDVRVPRFPPEHGRRSRISHGSSADDELRSDADALQRRSVSAIFRTGCRTGARCARRQGHHDDQFGADGERHQHRDGGAARVSVPAGQGERDRSRGNGGRILFQHAGNPLVEGRNFHSDDDENAPRVAIANQHFIQHYWPGQHALGRRFRLNDAAKSWVEIVASGHSHSVTRVAPPVSDMRAIGTCK
jgi:hypothetical protein